MPVAPPFGIAVYDSTIVAAGTNQATASQIAALTSVVGTVAAGAGVRLSAMPLETQTVINGGANVLSVYPQLGMTITGKALNAPFQIAPGHAVGFIVASATQAFAVFGSPSSFS